MIRNLDSYNYSYPDELVALHPLAAKDQANMLVFKKNIFSHQRVCDLLKYVPCSWFLETATILGHTLLKSTSKVRLLNRFLNAVQLASTLCNPLEFSKTILVVWSD